MFFRSIIWGILISCFGCAKTPESLQTRVEFKFPKSDNLSVTKYNGRNPNSGRLAAFSNLNEIDCYAILVSYGGAGNCVESLGNEVISHVNMTHGSVPDGGVIEFGVDSGPARQFSVIGFTTSLGSCPRFGSLSLTEQTLVSNPTLVGSTVADIEGDFVEVEIDISMTGAQDFVKCAEGPFAWEQANGGIWGSSTWDSASWGP
jgi:hypothetical protein